VEGAVVGLAAAIEALRAELTDAVHRGRNEQMQFGVEPIELTVQAVVTREADGKIGWSVLGLGGKYEAVTTQTLTLRLAPLWKATDGSLTTDFTIAATGTAGDTFGSQPIAGR
jgi:Trypsin-co-occurring domain 2